MKRSVLCLLFIILFNSAMVHSSSKKTIDADDLFAMRRITELDISNDGRYASFTVTRFNMQDNSQNRDVWIVNLNNGDVKQLTTHPKNDYHAKWCPVEAKIAFLSNRDGSPQLFIIPAFGGEAQKVTDIESGINDFDWSPDGQYIAYTSEINPSSENVSSLPGKDAEESKVSAKIIDGLFYRYWNYWLDGKRSHLFLYDIKEGTSIDLSPGDHDTPPLDLGSDNDFTFSPDSKEIAFVRNIDRVVAVSTNNDIFTTSIEGGTPLKVTENKATDNHPIYSPDGKYIAYRAMATPGYEADQYDIVVLERESKEKTNLTDEFDRSIGSFEFSPNGDYIYFNAYNEGRNVIYRLRMKDKKISKLITDNYNSEFRLAKNGKMIVFLSESINLPAELYVSDANGRGIKQLTHFNKDELNRLVMNDVEDFWYASFDERRVHGLLLKPPYFESDSKYPLILLIHGGPQGMWADQFHYRWNAQMFAAQGYVVAMINFRGSRGYGSEFCKAVSKDWGGGPYQDLMTGLDYLIDKYEFIDREKLAAAGASYGGFMINWIAGHTDRFDALVTHSGVYDQRSMYGTTEELWFPEWEFGGTPYENPELFEKWSPSNYARYFKTPTLVIHGANDFRVPVTQGFQMFTALQRNNVPSRLLYFPDEDHFIRKPQNAKLWWRTVHEWIAEWINK
ncbi:S9 family peptidase [candidate division KSB1 bacterium]|nr:S9 family peptidase [candidate division KSB1 bacterium]